MTQRGRVFGFGSLVFGFLFWIIQKRPIAPIGSAATRWSQYRERKRPGRLEASTLRTSAETCATSAFYLESRKVQETLTAEDAEDFAEARRRKLWSTAARRRRLRKHHGKAT